MTQQLKALNSKEIKHVHELLEKEFGYSGKLEVIFYLSEKKERIYIFTRDLANFDLTRLRIDSMGLYFGTLHNDELRLTIDATQMIGKDCAKNVIGVSKAEMQQWLMGEKLTVAALETQPDPMPTGFVIIKHGEDYLGCGKIVGEVILNYIPKTRFIHALYDDIDENVGDEQL